jgi:hypothetical protein
MDWGVAFAAEWLARPTATVDSQHTNSADREAAAITSTVAVGVVACLHQLLSGLNRLPIYRL